MELTGHQVQTLMNGGKIELAEYPELSDLVYIQEVVSEKLEGAVPPCIKIEMLELPSGGCFVSLLRR